MAGKAEIPVGHVLARLGRRQHGIVTSTELSTARLPKQAVGRLVRDGFLHPVYRGVFAVGFPPVSDDARWIAAVLACGPGAVLSHRSAAELWGLVEPDGGDIHVTVLGARRHPGIHAHRGTLGRHQRTRLGQVPVTTVPRTIVDLAGVLDPDALAAVVQETFARTTITERQLRRAHADAGRARGAVALREILGEGQSRSWLEREFHRLVHRLGLPPPERNVRLKVEGRTRELDALWRAQRLIVELDSRRYHLTPQGFERDRDRDAALLAMGWRTMRVTWLALRDDPDRVGRRLAAALTRRV